MTKKAEVIIKKNGSEIDSFRSKTLTKRLNKLNVGDEISIFIKEDKFGEQFVGEYIVKGLTNEPADEEPVECAPGMHWDGEKCVADAEDCPPGKHWDEDLKTCVDDAGPEPECPPGQHFDQQLGRCVDDVVTPPDTGEGEVDANGLQWAEAKGQITKVPQSRNQADDDRWSKNVTGLSLGYEQIMIAKSTGTGSGAHFASKLFGTNHSGGSNVGDRRWYDLGLRKDGSIQLQWEGPHPDNHDFDLPDDKLLIKRIGKGLEGNFIGLRWRVEKVNKQDNGSPKNGGIRCRMWVDEDPLGTDGKPKNNWKLAIDFTDGQDGISVINPQTYCPPDNMDIEVRRSNTKNHEVYGGGLFVRAL